MKKIDTRRIAIYGMVAALYAVLTIVLMPYSYYGVQFRISEALVLLCFYKKGYIVPLTIGCAIANLFSPMMALDLPIGTFATLISLLLITKSKNIYIAALFPVIINAVIVGMELKIALHAPLLLSMGQVALGEFVCVFIVGIILFKNLEKNKAFMNMIKFGEE